MSFPLNPDPQYRPRTLANLTAATGAATNYLDLNPNIDLAGEVNVDVSSLIPKVLGYLSGDWATDSIPPVPDQSGDSPAEINADGYFGPSLPFAGGPMPPFPPPSGAGGVGPGAGGGNANYGQPTTKKNVAPGSLILTWSVDEFVLAPKAYVVTDTSQAEISNPPQNTPWLDEVLTTQIDLPT